MRCVALMIFRYDKTEFRDVDWFVGLYMYLSFEIIANI